MKKEKLTIDNFNGGLSPAWFNSNYPAYGNRNMAGDLQAVDLTDPSSITQGPGLVSAAVVTDLLHSILDYPVSSGKTFAVGEDAFYELTPVSAGTASTPALPHTITGTSVSAQDVCLYNGYVYYSYNTAASANVGRYNTIRTAETDFDDDWASVSGSAHICAAVPLPLCNGGNGRLYLASANRLSSFVGSTATYNEDIVTIPADAEIQDLTWNEDRLFIAANRVKTQGFYTGQSHTSGTLLLAEADTASTLVTGTDYVIKKQIKIYSNGVFNTRARAHRYFTSSNSASVQLRKNYVSTASTGDLIVTYTWSTTSLDEYHDANLAIGDTVSMLVKTNGASTSAYADDLYLYVGEYFAGEPAPTVLLDA